MDSGGGAVTMPANDSDPVLITAAAPSYEQQLATRKRKYVIMMGCRIPCLIAAGLTYHVWWLALGFLAISVPLPWIAVLIANDRPPRKSEQVNTYQREAKTIESTSHRVIDG
ncbi:DUF3099 domain-containing protein [Amycolatopsis sp. NPDC026612]|uniref:DUF3099 domain-containing protein n=1 Tax=Amycolatopsis sp. NPDC026612 TaxID=3155466 RepID=UPI003407F5C5